MTDLFGFRAAIQQVMSSDHPAEFPARPLLYVAGAAAAGAYYCVMKRDVEEERAMFKNTPLTEDTVLLDTGWMADKATHSDSVVPEEYHRSETEESNRKVEVFSSLQNSKRSNLEKRVKRLEELLCEAQQECERRTKDYEAECEAHSTLKSCYNEIKKTLELDEELLKLTSAGTRKAYEQVMKSNAQLEHEKLDLMSQVDTLQSSVIKLEEKLSKSRISHEDTLRKLVIEKGILVFVKTKAALRAKHLKQWAESLQVSLDETQNKYDEALQTIRNHQRWQSDLETEISEQQETIHDLEEDLSESKTSYSTATSEIERLHRLLTDLDSKWNLLNDTILTNYGELSDDHLKLFRQYNELKEKHDKLQKITPVEAVVAFKQAMVTNAQLEKEKSKLMYHLHKLRSRVQQLEEMLYKADITCAVLKQDREPAEEAYNILMSQYRETFKQRNELLMVSLAEAAKKLGPAMESGAQRSYVNILQSSVQKLEKELLETSMMCRKLHDVERKKKREEQNILKIQYDEIMDIVKQCDEFFQVNHRSGLNSKEPVS